ncbi:hypothetical protein JCM30237_23710 [Halolamina litorea]|uniref:Plastocyanin/azurin family copper-binding protein n=1 Tax=Halolamina litorea TaxID=1515593 RepID=A0ABD6BTS5_9EURY|nr:plastocyanin/azurin family copper-binding protein [Halolamina litorea]
MQDSTTSSRRRFVQLVGATGVAVGLSGVASPVAAQDGDVAETFELLGEQSGWVGVAPEGIADTTNPTLEFTPGETYRIEFENGDGLTHNLVIINEAEEVLHRTDTVAEEGATASIEFEATEEMYQYYCEPHPQSMRGDINVGQQAGGGAGDSREELIQQLIEESDYVFDGYVRAWEGLAPESIEGESNPTIELEAGQEYTFGWINGDGEPHNIAIRDDDGENLYATEITSTEDATQTLTFEATTDAVLYICEVHPNSMVGDLTVDGMGTATPTEAPPTETEPPATETEAPETEPPATEPATEPPETETGTPTATDGPGFGGLAALAGVGAGAAAAARRLSADSEDEREE